MTAAPYAPVTAAEHPAPIPPQQAAWRAGGGILLRYASGQMGLRAWLGRSLAGSPMAFASGLALLAALAWLAPALAASLLLLATVVLYGLSVGLPGSPAGKRVGRRHHRAAAQRQPRLADLPVVLAVPQSARPRRRANRHDLRLRQDGVQRDTVPEQHRARRGAWVADGAAEAAAPAVRPLAQGGPHWRTLPAVAGATVVGLLFAPLRALVRAVEASRAARLPDASMPEPPRPAAPRPAVARPRAARACSLQFDGAALARRVGPIDGVVPHGRRVAVCGPSGSGKSSLLWMASGLVAPSEGLLLLDDMELCILDPINLRERIAFVAPQFGLQRGTVGSNLRQHCDNPDDDVLQDACDMAGLTPLLDRMPQGLSTRVHEGGLNLSLGERRALQLARALAGRPSVLLIDDVQACLPGDTASRLAGLLSCFDGTVIYSTTDMSLALLADDVWSLDLGCRVAEWPLPRRASEPGFVSRQLH